MVRRPTSRAAPASSHPQPVEAFNGNIWEFNPAIGPDGDLLVFTSIGRIGGAGLGDLFFARRTDGEWAPAQPLSVNTPGR